MDTIAAEGGVQRRACALLVDDRVENVYAARAAGYTGILVNSRTGITPPVARDILQRLEKCAQSGPPRRLG